MLQVAEATPFPDSIIPRGVGGPEKTSEEEEEEGEKTINRSRGGRGGGGTENKQPAKQGKKRGVQRHGFALTLRALA